MRGQKCYRVLVRDAQGHHWWPVIMARDTDHIVDKVYNLYPDGIVEDSWVVHQSHTQWAIVPGDRPLSAHGPAILMDGPIDRRVH